MFNSLEFRILDPITKEVIEQGIFGEGWTAKTDNLEHRPEFRLVQYKCPDPMCEKWHPFTLYYEGVEYLSSRIADVIATLAESGMITSKSDEPKWELP